MNSNLDNLLIQIVPNEYIFAQDDDVHRISTIVNMVNNKVHGISENRLIKAVIFHILRENNFKTDTLVPYLLIAVNNVAIMDLSTSATANYSESLAKRVLHESVEIDNMDKINNVLSVIVDAMPLDLKENMTPAIKQQIVTYLLTVCVQQVKESFIDTPAPDIATSAPSDTPSPSPSATVEYSPSPTPTSSLTSAPVPTTMSPSVTTPADSDYAAMRNQLNKITTDKIAWKYYMQAGSDTQLNSNANSMNSKNSNCNNKPILAQYVDNEPDLYVGRNDKVYLYDKTSNALHYMPNNMQDISISDLEKMLKDYNVSPEQIQTTIKNVYSITSTPTPSTSISTLTSKDTSSISSIQKISDLLGMHTSSTSSTSPTFSTSPLSSLSPTPTSATSTLLSTASEDTSKLIDVIKNYQSEYAVTNYIVMSFLAFIMLCIVIYIIYKLFIYSSNVITKA